VYKATFPKDTVKKRKTIKFFTITTFCYFTSGSLPCLTSEQFLEEMILRANWDSQLLAQHQHQDRVK